METSPASCQSKDTFGIPVLPPSPRMSQDDMRWSEMVPPNSALTFAVILDDDLDPVAFSGAELLRTRNSLDRTKSVDGPLDVTDGHSQILSVLARSSTNPLSTIEPRTATLAYFQDAHGDLFHDSSPSTQRVNFRDNHNRPLDTRTQTSSTLEGLDVYLRGSLLEKAHGRNRHFSCFDGLEGDFAFDPRTSFDNRYAHVFDDTGRGDTKQRHRQFEEEEVIDEGFSETPLINARPRLLTRTTSKASAHSAHPSPSKLRRPSNSIPPSTYHASPIITQSPQLPPIPTSDDTWRWSAIGTPTDPEALSSLRFATQSEAQRRRLRKTRTAGLDGTSSPPPPDDTTSRSPSESNRRQIAHPAKPVERRSIPAAPDVVLRRGFYNHQLPSVRESELVVHNSPEGHWTAPRQLSKRDALLHQPKSPLPFPGVPLATTIAPKVVKGLNNTYKHIKSSVQPEKDGWVYVDVKTEIKVKQRNV